ncbi:MAG: aldolase/citrate lyase family protein [Candidatus Omnitrophica bacterium]|nr:aldolase/citrate lyase family protein [Candidatus Omnitrophota bacterium]
MINLKSKLRTGGFTIGSWITLGHPAVAEIMAKAGFDWLVVDMEHSALTLGDCQQLVQIIELSGVVPLVRVGSNNSAIIKRVMDAGAHGVIVPMVNSKEDALMAVSAVKYPRLGTRGVGLARAQGYGLAFEKYKKWVNKSSIVIVQIEHKDAIKNLKEILSVPGVDGSMIGPYDLSASFGHPGRFDLPIVKEALAHYESVSRKIKKAFGYHVVFPDNKKAVVLKRKGYTFLGIGLDTLFLGLKINETLKGLR